MGENRPRLRPVTARQSQGLSKLMSLDCFEEVDLRVRRGWPLRQVARWIQDDLGQMKDYSLIGVVKILSEHRNTIPKAELAGEALTPVHTEAAREVERGLDEIDAMEELYEMQMNRIRMGKAAEDTANFLNKHMPNEIGKALDILNTRLQRKMDLGIGARRQPLEVEVKHALGKIEDRYGSNVRAVLENPERAGKLISLFRRLTNSHVVDVEEAGGG